jgi:hypothetical protein
VRETNRQDKNQAMHVVQAPSTAEGGRMFLFCEERQDNLVELVDSKDGQ